MKRLKKRLVGTLIFALLISIFCFAVLKKKDSRIRERLEDHSFTDIIQDGDIIFQSALSGQGQAVQLATRSKYSHCGMLFKKDGEWQVIEAVQPVRWTPLSQWIMHGDDYHFVVKRLGTDHDKINSEKLKEEAEQHLGKDYDAYFNWDDNQIYCSELVWKAYKNAASTEVGRLEKIADMNLEHPIVQEKLKERYGDKVPLNEIVITPASIFNSPNLIEVFKQDNAITIKKRR